MFVKTVSNDRVCVPRRRDVPTNYLLLDKLYFNITLEVLEIFNLLDLLFDFMCSLKTMRLNISKFLISI